MPRSSMQGQGHYQVTRQLIESKEINYLSKSIGEFSTITPAKLAKINAGSQSCLSGLQQEEYTDLKSTYDTDYA